MAFGDINFRRNEAASCFCNCSSPSGGEESATGATSAPALYCRRKYSSAAAQTFRGTLPAVSNKKYGTTISTSVLST